MANKIDVKDSDFEKQVIEQSKEKPVIVDFWAGWCMPCKMLTPTLDKIADEYKDKIVLAKCNVEEAREKASSYNVKSIPSVKLFKDGEVVDEFVGALPEQNIKDWLNNNLE